MRKWVLLAIIGVCSLVLTACNPLDRRTTAGLQVKTNDTSASLFLDGQYLDKTPYIDKEIKPGTYTLRIQPDDPTLAAYETTITLRKGLLTVVIWKPGTRPELSGGVIYEMEPLASKKLAELSLVSIPDGAIVSLDGQPNKEFAPLVINNIEPGQHEYEVNLPSYEGQKHTVNIVAGYRVNITLKLAKNAGDAAASAVPATSSPTTPQASNPPTASNSATRTPAPSSSPNPAVSTLTGPRVKIKSTNFFQNNQEVLRVRDAASNNGKKLGFAPVGSEYSYQNESSNGWYKILFNGSTGWVTGQYAELINR